MLAGAVAGFPRLQLSAGVDLHGRQRQPAARLQPGALTLEPRRRPRQPVRRAVGDRRPGVRAADSDLRHDARHGVAPAVRAGRRRSAAAITRRTGWWRSACRSAGGLRAVVAGGGRRRHRPGAPQRRRRAGRCWSAALFLLAMCLFAVYLARVRVYDDAAVPPGAKPADAARRRLHVQAARRRGAARLRADRRRLLRGQPAAVRPRGVPRQRRATSTTRCRSSWRRSWSRSSSSASTAADVARSSGRTRSTVPRASLLGAVGAAGASHLSATSTDSDRSSLIYAAARSFVFIDRVARLAASSSAPAAGCLVAAPSSKRRVTARFRRVQPQRGTIATATNTNINGCTVMV